MAIPCPICGSPVTDCICNVNLRAMPVTIERMGVIRATALMLTTTMRLFWPVPSDTRVTQTFGANPAWYPTSRGHNGVDFGVTVDTPVKVMKGGEIIRSDEVV